MDFNDVAICTNNQWPKPLHSLLRWKTLNESLRKPCGKPWSSNQNNDNWGAQTGQWVGQAYVAHTEEAHQEHTTNNFGIGGFKKEEIEQLRNLLSSLENPSASFSLAHSGKYSDSQALSALNDCFWSSWVSDLSTTDLMTDSSHCFSMLSPCPWIGNKKIKIVDDALSKVASQGTINLSSSLSLKPILHVPKLLFIFISPSTKI